MKISFEQLESLRALKVSLTGLNSSLDNPRYVNPNINFKPYNREVVTIRELFAQVISLLPNTYAYKNDIQDAINDTPKRTITEDGENLTYSSGMIFTRNVKRTLQALTKVISTAKPLFDTQKADEAKKAIEALRKIGSDIPAEVAQIIDSREYEIKNFPSDFITELNQLVEIAGKFSTLTKSAAESLADIKEGSFRGFTQRLVVGTRTEEGWTGGNGLSSCSNNYDPGERYSYEVNDYEDFEKNSSQVKSDTISTLQNFSEIIDKGIAAIDQFKAEFLELDSTLRDTGQGSPSPKPSINNDNGQPAELAIGEHARKK